VYRTLSVRIVGIAPLLMHNGQTADPLNKYAKALKEVGGKRKKTEADYLEMARIEYVAGLYMDASGPVIPSRMIEANITDGARKSKLGKLAQAGVIADKHASLEYEGPRDPMALFENDDFRFSVPVRIGQQRVVRTRPIFQAWAADIEVKYLDEVINERDLMTAVRNAGSLSGIGDWRPRYGRYALAIDMA
jgi:hypothetical protein